MGKQRVWTDAMVIVSIVSVGVVIAGLTNDSGVESLPAAYGVVLEPVDSDAAIPGCESVEPNDEPGHAVEMTIGDKPETYDNPDYPWFDGPRASAMSAALVGSLPADAELKFAGPRQSLVFQPILGGQQGGTSTIFESTTATGTVIRNGAEGMVTVSVTQNDESAPPCTAGALDARTTMRDGTVVDTLDTWYELAGQRSTVRSAVAYTPDGSRIHATTAGDAGRVVLSVDELATIAALPELRTTFPVPPGFVTPSMPCTAQGSTEIGSPLSREVVASVNDALNTLWDSASRPVVLDRPLGSLQLDQYSPASACEDLVYGSNQALTLTVTPTVGAYDYDPDQSSTGYEKTSTTLPDGSVLSISGIYVTSPTGWPQQTVALDTVSGMTVKVRASDRAVGLELLQSIVQTAGSVFA
ncbi:hypothetical protein [Rhodococcoides fascians]|uniref:hypothetical protein n=1 Tax=Rhodococcoides fascians TaxID=1828 RepID=UPI00068F5E49|nr:hypothetical protein [Rhodococcus fascians]